jgi:hypothetical protein
MPVLLLRGMQLAANLREAGLSLLKASLLNFHLSLSSPYTKVNERLPLQDPIAFGDLDSSHHSTFRCRQYSPPASPHLS